MSKTRQSISIALTLAAFGLIGCGEGAEDPARDEADAPKFVSTYAPLPREATVIEHATILTGTGERIDDGMLIMRDGKIEAVGAGLEAPADLARIDAEGKWVTPGIIDNHSHLGVYPSPAVQAVSDGNEISDPNTAQVWAEHAVWPQDPGFAAALAGGVTTLQILPGSANLFGGRSVVLKNVPARTVQEMKFPAAPQGLKMACGENPKRVYGVDRLVAPSSRMGNVAGYRQAWAKAQDYMKKQDAYESGTTEEAPETDLQLETLAGVLRGEIRVHNHCYRADEMAVMLDVAKEFGYHIASFHHAVEAYKIADLLAESGTCASMWADWWGFKLEAFDAVRENIAMVDAAGGCAIVHSDSDVGIQRLNQEAAKVIAAAQRAGIEVDRADAMRWLSLNPAKSLGIDERTGSLEAGKMGDVVIWDGDPFSVYTKAEQVYIDGALVYDRNDPAMQPVSDFELGLVSLNGEGR
ncbi:MAG: amidohydrolase family protein [Gammaproteobacteria bacterium]